MPTDSRLKLPGIDGRVALVVGAGSGIGRVCAETLASLGARVAAADINLAGARETVQNIEDAGGSGYAIEVDASSEASVENMVNATVEHFGTLHLLHNNAADMSIILRDADVVGMEIEVWDRTMAVNLRGPMLACKHAIPHMIRANGGAIVTTSSVSGQFGDVARVAYGVSKAGVESLMRYVATMYGKQGIRANGIAPGLIGTESMRRNVSPEEAAVLVQNCVTPDIGDPQDIADAVAFLLSEAATFITGIILNVDGGIRMHTPMYASVVKG